MGLTITGAAGALGVTRNTVSELVNGKRGISPEMAVRLSTVFGGTEQGWLLQQAQYDLAHVRRQLWNEPGNRLLPAQSCAELTYERSCRRVSP